MPTTIVKREKERKKRRGCGLLVAAPTFLLFQHCAETCEVTHSNLNIGTHGLFSLKIRGVQHIWTPIACRRRIIIIIFFSSSSYLRPTLNPLLIFRKEKEKGDESLFSPLPFSPAARIGKKKKKETRLIATISKMGPRKKTRKEEERRNYYYALQK